MKKILTLSFFLTAPNLFAMVVDSNSATSGGTETAASGLARTETVSTSSGAFESAVNLSGTKTYSINNPAPPSVVNEGAGTPLIQPNGMRELAPEAGMRINSRTFMRTVRDTAFWAYVVGPEIGDNDIALGVNAKLSCVIDKNGKIVTLFAEDLTKTPCFNAGLNKVKASGKLGNTLPPRSKRVTQRLERFGASDTNQQDSLAQQVTDQSANSSLAFSNTDPAPASGGSTDRLIIKAVPNTNLINNVQIKVNPQ